MTTGCTRSVKPLVIIHKCMLQIGAKSSVNDLFLITLHHVTVVELDWGGGGVDPNSKQSPKRKTTPSVSVGIPVSKQTRRNDLVLN